MSGQLTAIEAIRDLAHNANSETVQITALKELVKLEEKNIAQLQIQSGSSDPFDNEFVSHFEVSHYHHPEINHITQRVYSLAEGAFQVYVTRAGDQFSTAIADFRPVQKTSNSGEDGSVARADNSSSEEVGDKCFQPV